MELTYDWQSFQSVFYPKRRSATQISSQAVGPIYAIVDGNIIVTAFAESEDLSDWVGAEYEELAAEMPNRELLLLKREKVDTWLLEAVGLPHLYDQLDFLRQKAVEEVISTRAKPSRKGKRTSKGIFKLKHDQGSYSGPLGHQHFLLKALKGWWGKMLPTAYGVFIRLEGPREQDLMIIVRRGRLDAFHQPDLSSMGRDRRRVPADVVRYLSEKHLLPVQGIFVPAPTWAAWSDSLNPWRKVLAALRAKQAKLVPFRWGLVSLLASRAFLHP